MNKEDKISGILGAWNDPWSLKVRLEQLTGSMVSFRNRAKYNAAQARLQKAKRAKGQNVAPSKKTVDAAKR